MTKPSESFTPPHVLFSRWNASSTQLPRKDELGYGLNRFGGPGKEKQKCRLLSKQKLKANKPRSKMMRILDFFNNDRLTQGDVSTLQSVECRNHNGKTPKGSLAAIAQSSLKHSIKAPAETDPAFVRQFSADLNKVVDKDAAAKVCSIYSKLHKGRTPKKSLAARVQSAAARNENRHISMNNEIQTSLFMTGEVPISEEWARLLQSDTARRFDGYVAKGSTAALAQSAATKAKNLQLLRSTEGVEKVAEKLNKPAKMTVAKLQSAYAHAAHTANIPSRVSTAKVQSVADKHEAKSKLPPYSEPVHTNSEITEGFFDLP